MALYSSPSHQSLLSTLFLFKTTLRLLLSKEADLPLTLVPEALVPSKRVKVTAETSNHLEMDSVLNVLLILTARPDSFASETFAHPPALMTAPVPYPELTVSA